MNTLKYNKELYTDSGIYGIENEDITCYREKLVKCYKEHECVSCGRKIEKKDFALHESGFMDGFAVSTYTCIKCIEGWLEESGQIDEDEGE